MLVINSFLVGLMTLWLEYNAGFQALALAGLAAGLLLIPASSYWLFVVFFGKEAWPVSGPRPEMPREEKAFALLEEATKLESRGRVKEALAKYREVEEQFGGTAASGDAQKSMESLRTKLG